MNKPKVVADLLISFTLLFSFPVFASSFLSPLTDTVNSGIINTKIATDDSLSQTNIDATVVNGVAIFTGEVSTKSQVEELIRIAHSVTGINGIDTRNLKVIDNK